MDGGLAANGGCYGVPFLTLRVFERLVSGTPPRQQPKPDLYAFGHIHMKTASGRQAVEDGIERSLERR